MLHGTCGKADSIKKGLNKVVVAWPFDKNCTKRTAFETVKLLCSKYVHLKYVITYLTINSNKFTLNKNEYGFSNAGHIVMVCQIRGFYFREGQYGRIGTQMNSRAGANDCL